MPEYYRHYYGDRSEETPQEQGTETTRPVRVRKLPNERHDAALNKIATNVKRLHPTYSAELVMKIANQIYVRSRSSDRS